MVNPFAQLELKGVYIDYGHMVYDLVSIDNNEFEFAFLVKEKSIYINRHKHNPSVEFRTGLVNINGIWVVPFMILINRDYDMLYECVFNYHQTSGGKEYLDVLERQDNIHIIFFDENNKNARNIRISNQIKDEMCEYNIRLSSIKPWTMEQFDYAKLKMYEMFPTPMVLWNKLTRGGK